VAEIDPQASVATNWAADIGRANISPKALGASERKAVPLAIDVWVRTARIPIDPEQTSSYLA
jgi:hypothetical protein